MGGVSSWAMRCTEAHALKCESPGLRTPHSQPSRLPAHVGVQAEGVLSSGQAGWPERMRF